MRIRRGFVQATDNFTIVPNAWLRDATLSRRARNILSELLSHREDWDVTIESLWRGGTEGREAIRSAVKELENAGYLHRQQARGQGARFGASEYVLLNPHDETAGHSDAQLPGDGKPGDGKPGHGNARTKKNNQEEQPKNTNQVSSSAVADSPPAKAGGRERKPEPHREDVEALCARLREHIAANTGRPPNVTQSWRTAARLLLDKDDIEFDEAVRVLDWSQQDSFWMPNILSMPKFREKFTQLQMKSRQAFGAGGPSGSTPRYWNSGIEDSPQQDYIDGEVVGIDYSGFGELA